MSKGVRSPAVAGVFYPADPGELRQSVRGFLSRADVDSFLSPKALIVPHAGYIYSGTVAASAYACVQPEKITRVVLIGPSHRVFLYGMAAPESLVWEMPSGNVMIDFDSLKKAAFFPQILFSDKAHKEEHSLEVQLPFLKEILSDFRLIPLVVGDASPDEVAEVIESLWGGPETLIVVSSDLSHYNRYEQAVEKDRFTAQAIEGLDIRSLDSDHACGFIPIAGLVQVARQKGMRVERLDLRNSGDTAGPKDQVVGYGAFAFYE